MLLKVQTNLSLLKSSLFALLALLLSGCETELSPEPIRIVAPDRPFSEEWFIGSPFEYEFGIDGGSGSYSVEYLKSPPDGFGFETPSNENTVDMQVEILEGARPLFRLYGIPEVDDPTGTGGFSELEVQYYIRVNDGSQTEVFEYTVTLKTNTLDLGESLNIFEGTEGNITQALNALTVAENAASNPLVRQTVCETIRTEPIQAVTQINGRRVFFFYQIVSLDAPTAERFQVSYRVASDYSEASGELDAINIERARIGTDIYDELNTLVFNPYETECLFKVGIYEDDLIESEEDFRIEFFDRVGANVQLSSPSVNGSIRNDDRTVVYEPRIELLNLGEASSVEFVSESVSSANVEVLIGVDQNETTAPEDRFTLYPESGVLVFDDVVKSQFVSLEASNVPLVAERSVDKKVRVVSSVDRVNDLDEPLEFVINEWGNGSDATSDVLTDAGRTPVDVEATEGGDVFVLTEGLALDGSIASFLSSHHHNGLELFPTLEISKPGVNVKPIALESAVGEVDQLFVLFQVDGLFGSRAWGGLDFVLSIYEITDSGIVLERTIQDGSELDDEVKGLSLNINDNVLVYGQTAGLSLSGASGEVISSGGVDGFVYYYSAIGSIDPLTWTRFAGSVVDESMISVIGSRSDAVILTQTDTSPFDIDARIIDLIDASDAEDPETDELIRIAYPTQLKGMVFDQDQSRFMVFGGSQADLPANSPTVSGNEDAFVMAYQSSGVQNGVVALSTPGSDRFTVGATLSDSDLVAFGGETTGSLSGQTNRGLQDGMLAILDLDEGFEIAHSTQFGTPGNDYVLDLEAVGNHKFLMLWAEDFTSGDGSLTYRVTAFDRKARKMSPDPQ